MAFIVALALIGSAYSWPVLCALALLSACAHMRPVAAQLPTGWTGHETHYRSNAAVVDLQAQYNEQTELISAANKKSGNVVYPEISSGEWSSPTAELWQDGLRSPEQSVLLGALVIEPHTEYYHNAIVGVSKDRVEVLYRQRMPSPLSMWHPWTGNGAAAHWFSDPVFNWRGKRLAALICHEQYLVWPIIHSLLHRPELLVATGNLWWCKQTRLPRVQRTLVRSWAKLANIPIIEAYNE